MPRFEAPNGGGDAPDDDEEGEEDPPDDPSTVDPAPGADPLPTEPEPSPEPEPEPDPEPDTTEDDRTSPTAEPEDDDVAPVADVSDIERQQFAGTADPPPSEETPPEQEESRAGVLGRGLGPLAVGAGIVLDQLDPRRRRGRDDFEPGELETRADQREGTDDTGTTRGEFDPSDVDVEPELPDVGNVTDTGPTPGEFETRGDRRERTEDTGTARGEFDPADVDVPVDTVELENRRELATFAATPALAAAAAVQSFDPGDVEPGEFETRADQREPSDDTGTVRGDFDPVEVDVDPVRPTAPDVGGTAVEVGEFETRADSRERTEDTGTARGEFDPTDVDVEPERVDLDVGSPTEAAPFVLGPAAAVVGVAGIPQRGDAEPGEFETRADQREPSDDAESVRGEFDPTDVEVDIPELEQGATATEVRPVTALTDPVGTLAAVQRGDEFVSPEFLITDEEVAEGITQVGFDAAAELTPGVEPPEDSLADPFPGPDEERPVGEPVPLVSPVGAAGVARQARETLRAIRASRTPGAGTQPARTGPVGGDPGRAVGRFGEFAAEGTERVVRTAAAGTAVGTGIREGTVTELPAQEPAQDVEEIEVVEPTQPEISEPGRPTTEVTEVEPVSPDVAEVEVPEEPRAVDPTEIRTQPELVDPEEVEPDGEDPRVITEDDILPGVGDPEQDPPGVRERQRRDDLVTFEREFPTGRGAVIGREAVEEPTVDVTETPGQEQELFEDPVAEFGTRTEVARGPRGVGVVGPELGTGTDVDVGPDVTDDVTTDVTPDVTQPTIPDVTTPEVTQPTTPEVTEPTVPDVAEPTIPEVATPPGQRPPRTGAAPPLPTIDIDLPAAPADRRDRRRQEDEFRFVFDLDVDPVTGSDLDVGDVDTPDAIL